MSLANNSFMFNWKKDNEYSWTVGDKFHFDKNRIKLRYIFHFLNMAIVISFVPQSAYAHARSI